MQQIAQGTEMSEKKGLHIFKVGDLVLADPFLWTYGKAAKLKLSDYQHPEEDDIGIILEIIYPKHPTRDKRQVRVFWQKAQFEKINNAELVWHLHHDYLVEKRKKEFEDANSNS